MKTLLYFITTMLLAILSGAAFAETPTQPSVTGPEVRSIQNTIVELASDALPTWRHHSAKTGPSTLVLFSNEPFLQPIPVQLKKQALELAKTGTPEQFLTSGRFFRPNPILLPSQATAAALDCGYFNHVIWVLPSKTPVNEMNIESFRQQLLDSGILTLEESKALILTDGVFRGTLRGQTFTVATTHHLPPLSSSTWIHLDLSYVQALYKNQIKTPIYPILYDLAARLTAPDLPIAGATISLSTEEEGMVRMKMRFVGRDFAGLLSHPEQLYQQPSSKHDLRSESYYYADMMATDKAFEPIDKAAREYPDDNGLLYDYYQSLRVLKKGTEALHVLDLLISREPGYGYEYLALAKGARDNNKPAAGLKMLKKARGLYPENHYIKLELLDRYLELGQMVEARAQLDELTRMSWSKVYYSNMPELLERYKQRIE